MGVFDEVKVGDQLIREMKGFRGQPNWLWEAEVVEIKEDLILCKVLVDQYRTMVFNKTSGINVLGREYGWLVLP